MIFKFRYRLLGGHVHIRVFAGRAPHALGLSGTLIMREEEWSEFTAMCLENGGEWVGVTEFVDDTAAGTPKYNLPLDGEEFV